MKRFVLLAGGVLVFGSFQVKAGTIQVPAEQPTIQSGIDVAVPGDTVLVTQGVYTGPGNWDVSYHGKAIVVLSAAGPDFTIIDCRGTSTQPHRGFLFSDGEDSNSVLAGFTICNGFGPGAAESLSSNGAAIHCDASSPTVIDCNFRANVSISSGGAMACINGAAPQITGCRFENNTALLRLPGGYGGGLRCVSSSPRLKACVFTYNQAGVGGAISCNESDIEVDSCGFYNNTALGLVTFENISQGIGGALHLHQSAPRIEFYEFVANTALPMEALEYAGGWGGAIFAYSSDAMISNCTFFANSAQRAMGSNAGQGAGLYLDQSSPVVARCVIAGSIDGDAVHCGFGVNTPELSCCNIVDNAGGDWIGCIASQLGINGNFDADPLFCDVAHFDLSLMTSSPCHPESSGCGLVGAGAIGCPGLTLDTLWLKWQEQGHVLNHQPVFSWYQGQVFPQTEYEVEVGSDADWSTAELWLSGVVTGVDTAVAYGGDSLYDGSTYYSRVRVGDGVQWSTWIQAAFTMNSIPALPIQLSPIDDIVLTGSRPLLSALVAEDLEGDAQRLQFTLHQLGSPTQLPDLWSSVFIPLAGVSAGDTISWRVPLPLQENTLYAWFVTSSDGYETSGYTPLAYFSIGEIIEPGSPTSPIDDTILYSITPDYVWTAAENPSFGGPISYDFLLSTDSAFVLVFPVDSLAETLLTSVDTLDYSRRYWWKVTSRDTLGPVSESISETFRTYVPGDVNESWTITSADIIALVGYVFKGAALIGPACAGSMNGDAVVTSSDIIYLVNYIFKGGPLPQATCE